uniref:exodeoxyribonuclease III n=1 Tax=Sinocyclocheilus grahami TaxID=75366 RepID=A0A672P311_SINGR
QTETEHLKLRRGWVGQVFSSSFNSHSRGVAILIHKKLHFRFEDMIKDTGGRYILILGQLFGERVLIGSVYAPNSFEPTFFSELTANISSFSFNHMIIGGDFNCALDPSIDLNPPKYTTASRQAVKLIKFCEDFGLLDAWRIINPKVRDFTFYSHPHRMSSRIDFVFVSRQIMDRTKECAIGICTLSEHKSVYAVISPAYINPASRHWRLQSSLLSYPKFLEFLEKEWMIFMENNKQPDTDPSLLWQTAKAYIRGSIISYSAAGEKSLMEKQLELERLVKDLQNKFINTPSCVLWKELDAARSALNQILNRKAETSLLFVLFNKDCHTPMSGD